MYASAEKVYDASLRKRAVCVLSNNDGTIVAACSLSKSIAKQHGFKLKFEPYFKVKNLLEKHGIVAKSSNYELYSNLSQNLMDICARFAPRSYVYSIDEIFLAYPSNQFKTEDWLDMASTIRQSVWKETKLPVGVGFGPTLTLAKAASHAGKRIDGFRGIAVIDSEEQRKFVLSKMELTDVWGIGKRIGAKLNFMGINNALELAEQNPTKMRKEFSILVENTVRELNGEKRLKWDNATKDKKEIYSTKSFGQRITEKDQLAFALATHAATVGAKLRKQNSLASSMTIFAHSSPHDNEPFFRKSAFINFAVPTSDTRIITAASEQALDSIYKPNVKYYKCGLGLLDLRPSENFQSDLFNSSMDNPKLMGCIDQINSRYGRGTVRLAATGRITKFAMRRELLSPQYTTKWSDIPKIKC